FMTGTSEPWNLSPNDAGSPESAMNTAFGTGEWTKVQGYTAAGFSSGYDFIYIDGGDGSSEQFNAFVPANLSAMQQYVANGGHLFLNAARGSGGDTNIGFNAVLHRSGDSLSSTTGTAVDPANPIFNGAGTSWSGNFFSHDTITGNNLTPLITGQHGTVLAMESFGAGVVYIGSITDPYFQSPSSQADILRANILSVASGFNGQANQITLSDEGSDTLVGAKVAIAGNFNAAQDLLSFTAQSGITGNYDAATGVLTLTGTASLAAYQAVLDSVQYHNTSESPVGLTRTLTYQVDDGSAQNNLSNFGTLTVNVAGAEVLPVAQNGSAGGNEDTPIGGQVHGTDANGHSLTYGLVGEANGGALHGTVVMNLNGSFTYTPTANFNGTDS